MSDEIPGNLKYTEDHEWVLVDGDVATIGITHHAQDQLGDLVYFGDFPEVGDAVEEGDVVGVVESVKATSDIYTPLTGEVVEINGDLEDQPELANTEPYDGAWIIKIKIGDADQLSELMTAEAYTSFLEG
jgi:glycine cleavage system H protein